MRDVHIIGTGMIPFGKHFERTVADIGWPAIKESIAEAGIERGAIEAAYCGTVHAGMMTGARTLKMIGLTGIPICNIENACASSATAFREAWIAVSAGIYDVALVFGIEKLTKMRGGPLPVEGEDFEAEYGLMMPALYAMRARRYLHDYGLDQDVLGQVAVKARKHGALNELAQDRREMTIEEYRVSPPVAEPLRRRDCCPTGDGAAAVILASGEYARKIGRAGIKVRSSTLSSGLFMTGFRDMASPEITIRCAAKAYEAAGLGPTDLDVVEVHDAFTIAEVLYYEALGLCPPGDAAKLLAEGATSVGGRIPVNPSGGLLSKGHPVGASGAAQIVEITRQLQGRCGPRQVEGARIGMTHITGGGVSGMDHGACAIHVLENVA